MEKKIKTKPSIEDDEKYIVKLNKLYDELKKKEKDKDDKSGKHGTSS